MSGVTVRNIVSFAALIAHYKVRRRLGNGLVALHLRCTPQRSTSDTLRDIAQENLAAAIRKNEQVCHTLQCRIVKIGKLIDEPTD